MFGVTQWDTAATATAKGGYSTAGPPPGTLFPAGISLAFFNTYPYCSGDISTNPSDACYPQHLTPGNLNVPGGFGWLKFGCDGYGLGQDPPANAGGCAELEAVPAGRDRSTVELVRLLHPGRGSWQLPTRSAACPATR